MARRARRRESFAQQVLRELESDGDLSTCRPFNGAHEVFEFVPHYPRWEKDVFPDESVYGSVAESVYGLGASTLPAAATLLDNQAAKCSILEQRCTAPTSPCHERLLLDGPVEDSTHHDADAELVVQKLLPVLEQARSRDRVLLRVSLTMPPWRNDLVSAHSAASQFVHHLAQASDDAILVLDISPEGAPHWYGFVLVDDTPNRKAARQRVTTLWTRFSSASSDSVGVKAVTGWGAFVDTGDVDVLAGKESFMTNLMRAMNYMLKPLPGGVRRDLTRDVYEAGDFCIDVASCG